MWTMTILYELFSGKWTDYVASMDTPENLR